MRLRQFSLIAIASLAALTGGCAGLPGGGPRATAVLLATTGNSAAGTVHFVQSGGKVLVHGEVRGLKPNGQHGFHVHEKGDCSSGDGMSTGGHFNPGSQPHGRHAVAMHHVGDLPSMQADGRGVAQFSFESSSIAIGSGANDVVGKGLIVHRDPDDYTTQPTGNAGPRLACAVIARS